MTLAELKTKANAVLTNFWQELQVRQDAYFAKHGKYFQLLITDPVVDGVDTTWVLKHPSDERHSLDVNFSFNSPVPFSISVDEWGRHNERGYSATATIELPNGDRYQRTRQHTGEDTNWQLIEPEVWLS